MRFGRRCSRKKYNRTKVGGTPGKVVLNGDQNNNRPVNSEISNLLNLQFEEVAENFALAQVEFDILEDELIETPDLSDGLQEFNNGINEKMAQIQKIKLSSPYLDLRMRIHKHCWNHSSAVQKVIAGWILI